MANFKCPKCKCVFFADKREADTKNDMTKRGLRSLCSNGEYVFAKETREKLTYGKNSK